MSQTTVAHIIAFLTGAFALGGVSGVTSTDINGFVDTLSGLISLASIVWAYVSHRKAVNA